MRQEQVGEVRVKSPRENFQNKSHPQSFLMRCEVPLQTYLGVQRQETYSVPYLLLFESAKKNLKKKRKENVLLFCVMCQELPREQIREFSRTVSMFQTKTEVNVSQALSLAYLLTQQYSVFQISHLTQILGNRISHPTKQNQRDRAESSY